MPQRRARGDELRTEAATTTVPPVEVGWLVSGSTPHALLVDFPSNTQGSLPARSTVEIDAATLEKAVSTRQGVVLLFERGRPELPIVTGLIHAKDSPLVDMLLGSSRPAGDARNRASEHKPDNEAPTARTKRLEARLDGKRVVLEADHEIVLRCGDASITLTRDGKVLLRGAYVETRSRGVNRIKGAAVKIN